MDFATEALKMTGALIAVLILMGGAAALVRKYLGGAGGVGGAPALRVVGGLRLGPGKSVILVELAGEVLVLGATAKELTLLTKVDDPHRIEQLRPGVGMNLPSLPWSTVFMKEKTRVASESKDGQMAMEHHA